MLNTNFGNSSITLRIARSIKNNVTVTVYPALPDMQKSTAWSEGSHASPACPSDNSSITMKMSTEHWWNDTDRGRPKYWQKNLSQFHFVHTNLTQSGLGSNLCLHGRFMQFIQVVINTLSTVSTLQQ
jgi:hypothetical protein